MDNKPINPFKISGPEMCYEIARIRCCRIWPIVSATLTWSNHDDAWKREAWWWRTCGLCGEYPRPLDSRVYEGDLMR